MAVSKEKLWTTAQDDILREGNALGLSASIIALQLKKAGRPDTTRNAVIGRRMRLKLVTQASPSRRKPTTRYVPAKKERASKPTQKAKEAHSFPAEPIPDADVWNALPGSTPVDFDDLKASSCRWPIGAKMPLSYCGCQKMPGSSYCETHAAKSAAGPKERKSNHYSIAGLGNATARNADEFLKEPA